MQPYQGTVQLDTPGHGLLITPGACLQTCAVANIKVKYVNILNLYMFLLYAANTKQSLQIEGDSQMHKTLTGAHLPTQEIHLIKLLLDICYLNLMNDQPDIEQVRESLQIVMDTLSAMLPSEGDWANFSPHLTR
jgi:hypothetical protein